jgi:hypothetical protein
MCFLLAMGITPREGDKGFDALQNVFIALQKLANRTKKKQ